MTIRRLLSGAIAGSGLLFVVVACTPDTTGIFSETERDLSCDVTSCDACTTCTTQQGGICQGSYEAFVGNPDSELYYTCVAGCADEPCRDNCGVQFEQAGNLYSQLSVCLHCTACPVTCGDPFSEC